jgi:hypothetical protein
MAAVTVADEEDSALRAVMKECRDTLKVPTPKPLHWQEHVKVFPRRRFVASKLAAVEGLTVNYIIFEKSAIPATSAFQSNQVAFYNYAAGLMMERLLLTARDWPGGSRELVANFGHVRGFNHEDTYSYFNVKKLQAKAWMPWHLLRGRVKFTNPGMLDGLQAADQYAGMLKAALCADDFGNYEEHHLLAIQHQIRRVKNKAWGYGFKAMALPDTFENYPWWEQADI